MIKNSLSQIMIQIIILTLTTSTAFARKELSTSNFDVVPLNSPVKDKEARFLIKLPKEFTISKIKIGIAGPKTPMKKPSYKDIKPIMTSEGPELRLSVSDWKTGSYRLYIQIKDKSQKESDLQKKYRDYVSFGVINGTEPVKMPNPKLNNQTLLGIDSNDNGIRDDVEVWINQNYTNQPEMLLAMQSYARAKDDTYRNLENKANSNEATHRSLDASSCLHLVMKSNGKSFDEGITEGNKLEGFYTNTKERILAQIKMSQNFHGESREGLDKDLVCEF